MTSRRRPCATVELGLACATEVSPGVVTPGLLPVLTRSSTRLDRVPDAAELGKPGAADVPRLEVARERVQRMPVVGRLDGAVGPDDRAERAMEPQAGGEAGGSRDRRPVARAHVAARGRRGGVPREPVERVPGGVREDSPERSTG